VRCSAPCAALTCDQLTALARRYLQQSPAFRAFCQWLFVRGSSTSSSFSSEVQMLFAKEEATAEFHVQRLQWAR
jgi:hypothetical protein